MWTFTAYIIYKLAKQLNSKTICFSDLTHSIFDILWKKYGVVLNNSTEELEREVEYLKEIGAIDFDGDIITIKEKLKEIAKSVEKSCPRDTITLYNIYLSKIDEAIKYYVDRIMGIIKVRLEKGEITLRDYFHVYLAKFRCPVCGYKLNIANLKKGSIRISCPKCGSSFRILGVEAYIKLRPIGDESE